MDGSTMISQSTVVFKFLGAPERLLGVGSLCKVARLIGPSRVYSGSCGCGAVPAQLMQALLRQAKVQLIATKLGNFFAIEPCPPFGIATSFNNHVVSRHVQ